MNDAVSVIEPITTDNAGHYVWGDGCDGWHLLNREDMSVILERVPPGKCENRHFHRVARQLFFILEGTATMELEHETVRLAANQSIVVAPGTPHRLRNESSADLRFLVISVPPSHRDRVDLP